MSVIPAVRRSPLILLLIVAALSFRPTSASAASNDELDYLNRINALRASVGVGPLAFDANMNELARQHNDVMASTQNLFHTPSLQANVTVDWQKLGENVGMGSNTQVVFDAFVKSPHHYENLVDPAFTHIGIAVTTVNGVQWTTHRFVQINAPKPAFVPPPPPPSTMPPTTRFVPPPTAPPVTVPPTTRPVPTTTPVTVPPTVPVTEPTTTTTIAPPDRTPADAHRVDELLRVLRFNG